MVRIVKASNSTVTASISMDADELYSIIDELEADGFDTTDRQEIMMGLGGDLGYDRQDAAYICRQIMKLNKSRY